VAGFPGDFYFSPPTVAQQREGIVMSSLRLFFCVVCLSSLCWSPAQGVTYMVDAVEGAGFAQFDAGPLPQIFGAQVGTPLEIDYVFNDMMHIELREGASTNIEFGVGNTGNNVDLDYRIVVDLSDMNGDLITNEAIVVEGTASAGFIQLENLPLLPLPPGKFHDLHIAVETVLVDPVSGGGTFDFYVAGGGGDPGTGASGPVRFNRATVGIWVPEPPAWTLLPPLAVVACWRLRRQRGSGPVAGTSTNT
jgi:hypothetical protein